MWNPTTRAHHTRAGLRYGSDLTDAEWAVLEPLLPPRSCGRRRRWPMREIVNAIFDAVGGGIPGRMLPENFPPPSTVYRWFATWRDSGVWQSINHHLVMADRERVGRGASPTAGRSDREQEKKRKR